MDKQTRLIVNEILRNRRITALVGAVVLVALAIGFGMSLAEVDPSAGRGSNESVFMYTIAATLCTIVAGACLITALNADADIQTDEEPESSMVPDR